MCELLSRPYVNMGVCDDWPYILMTQKLAATGHVVYNGWAAPMLTWQLYLAAALVKLFGFSATIVRMSTMLVAIVLGFFLQRILVRANISERNAMIGTLAFVLSPLYLMISPTFMTDIHGLFAVVLCLYGCLRALQANTSRATISWLCFAIAANAICGTSRQIAWLGILVMVPSTLWLLRAQRRVLLAGAAATLAGVLFIFGCLHWLKQQPYTIPEHLLSGPLPLGHTLAEFSHAFLDAPFFLLPIIAVFLPEVRKSSRRVALVLSATTVGYILFAILRGRQHPGALLEPLHADWVGVHGIFESMYLQGTPPVFLHTGVRVLLTIVSIGGLFGLIASFIRTLGSSPVPSVDAKISWKQLGVLFTPFFAAYTLLLIPRAGATGIFDRYLLVPLVLGLVCLVRYYQERIQLRLPFASVILVAIMAIYGIAVTHNLFALYRARVALAAEMRASGIPDSAVDHGWEYNLGTELEFAKSLNFPTIKIPANFYVATPPQLTRFCPITFYDYTPHIHPVYSISFEPDACGGLAPFAPVTYSRWLASTPGTLYAVHFAAQPKH